MKYQDYRRFKRCLYVTWSCSCAIAILGIQNALDQKEQKSWKYLKFTRLRWTCRCRYIIYNRLRCLGYTILHKTEKKRGNSQIDAKIDTNASWDIPKTAFSSLSFSKSPTSIFSQSNKIDALGVPLITYNG